MQAEIERSRELALSRPWRISPKIVIALFALLMLTPLAVQMAGRGPGGSGENRALASFPDLLDLRGIETLSRRLEQYVGDHFGLRDQMVRANAILRYRLGLSTNPEVAIGRDGWLFYTAERIMEQHVGVDVFSPSELEQWVARMEANRAWLAERGIPFVMTVAPDKSTIYPELIPQFPQKPGTMTRVDQIIERLKGTQLEVIDPRAAIIAAKSAREDLYYSSDSHWSQHGAFIAYEMLMDHLKARYPDLPRAHLSDYDTTIAPLPADLVYLMGLQGVIAPEGEVLTRRAPGNVLDVTTRLDKDRPPFWGWPVKFHETRLRDAPRALIFGDSFTDYILGPSFLYESFRDPVFTHHNNATFNFELVKEVKPDIVIVVIAERYLKTIPWPPVGF